MTQARQPQHQREFSVRTGLFKAAAECLAVPIDRSQPSDRIGLGPF